MTKNLHQKNMSKATIYLSTQQMRGGGVFRGSRRVIINQIPWHRRRPLIADFAGIELQRASVYAVLFASAIGLIQLVVGILEMVWLGMASPGARYFRVIGPSLMFVYSGNQIVRWVLFAVSMALALLSVALLVLNVFLSRGIYLENEYRFRHWLVAMAVFIGVRLVAVIFQSIANDMYFAYHIVSAIFWVLALAGCSAAWVVVLSNYQELADISRLEELYGVRHSNDAEDDWAENMELEQDLNSQAIETPLQKAKNGKRGSRGNNNVPESDQEAGDNYGMVSVHSSASSGARSTFV